MKTQYSVFVEPYKVRTPGQIKRIRVALVGRDLEKWADWFCIGVDLAKAWETPETSKRHRECSGPAGRLMAIAAQMAAGKTANLIRLAAEGGLKNA